MSDPKSISIEPRENGPLLVKNLESLRTDGGDDLETRPVFALCRCGASKTKPFCDGTHTNIDFSSDRESQQRLDRSRAYEGARITLHDNRNICWHAKECVNRLPHVFDASGRPWITPDAEDDAEKIMDVVNRCPSGALTYTRDGTHSTGTDTDPEITIVRDGPLNVSGPITLEGDLEPPVPTRYSLCRCGASRNRPFCDGSHVEAGFRDD